MRKIGFLTIAHSDYLADGSARRFAAAAAESLRRSGTELVQWGEPVCGCRAAREAALELVRQDVSGVVLFFASWLECSVAMAALREIEHLPVFLWAFPMWEENGAEKSTGSYVSYAMFQGVLNRIGFPFGGLIETPGETAPDDVLAFCRAADARQYLRRSRIGLVGYTSMSIYTGTFDHLLLRTKIGPEVEQSDAYSLIRMAESAAEGEIADAEARMRAAADIRPEVTPGELRKAAGLYAAIRRLRETGDLDAVNIKCQYEFSKEYGMTACVPLSLAAEPGFITSCEGDVLCTVSMMMLGRLTGGIVTYGDAINHAQGVLKLSPCGYMPYALSSGGCVIRRFPEGIGFTGLMNSFTVRPGKITFLRLVEDVGSYHLLYGTGEGLASSRLRGGVFPSLDVRPDGSLDELVKRYAGQHFAFCPGDVSREIAALGRMLGAETVRV